MTHTAATFQPTGATYSPGGWVALAANRTWLLMHLAPSDPRLQQCWAALAAGAGAEAVLEPLFADGLAGVPDFALVAVTALGPRVVLRGRAAVRCGPTVLGAGSAILFDSVVSDLPSGAAVLLTGGDETDTSLRLPLSAGVSMAGSIRLAAAAEPVADAETGAHPDSDDGAEPLADAVPSADQEPEPEQEADLVAEIEAGETPEPEAAVETDAAEAAGEFDHLFAETVHPEQLQQIREELRAEAAGPAPHSSDGDAEEADQQKGPAAVDSDVARGTPAAATADPAPPAPVTPVYQTQQWATRPPLEDAGLIDSVPWMTDSAAPPVAAAPTAPTAGTVLTSNPASAAEESVTGPAVTGPSAADQPAPQLTVKRSALAAMTQSGGPMVMASYCPARHPNPPHAARCRQCGQPVPEQEPVEIARPMLGVLRLSTGEAVSLDRGVLIGREPSNPETAGQDRPHVLRLPNDLQVSRNHVEIALDGWRVRVIDLGSTNGTFVTAPQQPTMRLNEHDPQLIDPGTEVRLSDEFSFTYEVSS